MTPDQITNHIEKAHQLAASGDLQQAESLVRRVLKSHKKNVDANHVLSLILFQKNELRDAQKYGELALKAAPENAYLHYVLGNIKRSRNRPEEAIKDYTKALALNSQVADIFYNLALCYQDTNQFDQAILNYKKALQLEPDFGEAWYNLALIYQTIEQYTDASQAYQKAAALLPDTAQVFNNLGIILEKLGDTQQAEKMYQQAISVDPDFAIALINLANIHKQNGDDKQAIVLLQQAITADPYNEIAGLALGYILQKNDYYEDTIPLYRKILEFSPDSIETLTCLGESYQSIGETEKARECYHQALSLGGHDVLKVKLALCIPVISESVDQINTTRNRICRELDELKSATFTIEYPNVQVNRTTFYLAYHGRNDLMIHRKLADIYSRVCPALTYRAIHCHDYKYHGGKIHIGFVSMHFNNHSIGRVMKNIIAGMNREHFHVTTFNYPHKQDDISDFIIAHSDKVINLTSQLFNDQKTIAAEELDILFYADIGMDPDTYFLGFARLAPVQCVTWGHPVTTGIPNIDYFLSGEYFEPDDAQQHYSEKLIRLRNLLTCFEAPVTSDDRQRSDFALPEDKHLYLCPQQLFKFHPDFDDFMAEILRRDEKAEIILVDSRHTNLQKILQQRIRNQIADLADRIRIIPYPGKAGFIRLMQLADVMLDTIHYGGGVTSLEGLSMDIPIVTMPGSYQRSRHTCGYYKLMGVMDFVTTTKEEYVSTAVRLANDRQFNLASKSRISQHKDILFNNSAIIPELEACFKSFIQQV